MDSLAARRPKHYLVVVVVVVVSGQRSGRSRANPMESAPSHLKRITRSPSSCTTFLRLEEGPALTGMGDPIGRMYPTFCP
jgi:hypothetical protein